MMNKDKYPGDFLYEEYADREVENCVDCRHVEAEFVASRERPPEYLCEPVDDQPPKTLLLPPADA